MSTEIAEESKPHPKDQNQSQNGPDEKQLQKSISVAKKVVDAQKTAESLKERAMKAVNPKERMRLLQEAYQKEVEAHGQSKYAKRLQSGVWQGGTAGGGIGAGIAMGVGAVTGTLVSGLVSVPTVLLGGLVGAGVGTFHGPWIKLGLGGGDKKEKPMSDEEVRAKAMKEAEALDDAVEKGANTVPQPPRDEDGQQDGAPENPETGTAADEAAESPQRRKPKKLQVRSSNEVVPPQERKKPRKLEVRSGAERKENV